MNILVIQTTASGIYYHRQYVPHFTWTDSGDDFKQDLVVIVEATHFDKIKSIVNQVHFDIVQYSIAINPPPDMPKFIEFMKRRGSKIVLDVDDLYKASDRKDVRKAVKIADAITTVSESLARFYAKEGAKYSPYIIENGINSKERQFQPMHSSNDEVVFGYLGSTRHEDDLRVMQYDFSDNKLLTVCEEYYGVLNVDHYTTLKHWTEYAWEYNAIDVALAPLVPSAFNDAKSFLKVIEAGFKKKAIICSDTQPYNREIHKEFRDVIDLIPVGTSWEDRVKSYTLDEAKERGEALYELVQPYEVRNLNKKRREIYQEIIDKPRR